MQLLTKAWTQWRPHRIQSLVWRCNDRFQAWRAGRRSGKTSLAKRRLVRALAEATCHGEPARCLYLAPTRDQAKRIAWDDFKALIHPSYLIGNPKDTELIIKTIWGSELYVGGFDVPQRFEGTPWDYVVVDESSDIKPGAVDKSLRPAVADRQGKIWRIGVPKRTGIGAKEFKEICEDRTKGYTFFEWSAETVLPEAELALLREHLDKKDYDEQIRAIAVEASGKAYESFVKRHWPEGNLLSSNLTQYNPARRIVVGSDFNVNPMAWVLCHAYDGAIYVFDEIWLNDTTTRQTLDELYRRYSNHRAGWTFLGDATGQARKTAGTVASNADYLVIKNDTRFANTAGGVNCIYPKSNPLIKDRLASVNALCCNAANKRRLFVSPTCVQLISDLDSRQLKDSGEPTSADKFGGHITDALGYIVYALFPIQLLSADLDLVEVSQGGIEFTPQDELVAPASLIYPTLTPQLQTYIPEIY